MTRAVLIACAAAVVTATVSAQKRVGADRCGARGQCACDPRASADDRHAHRFRARPFHRRLQLHPSSCDAGEPAEDEDGRLDVAFFVVQVPQGPLTPAGYADAYRQALAKFDAVHRLTEQIAPKEIQLALTSADVSRIAQSRAHRSR